MRDDDDDDTWARFKLESLDSISNTSANYGWAVLGLELGLCWSLLDYLQWTTTGSCPSNVLLTLDTSCMYSSSGPGSLGTDLSGHF